MKMKIIGILMCVLVVSTALPLASAITKNIGKSTEKEGFSRVHLRALGTFQSCEESQVIYGHILIGVNGLKIVINEDIEVSMDDIKWIIMTKHLLNCVITK
jgi:hypothetical protein